MDYQVPIYKPVSGETHAARMTQLDGASLVVGLHLKHSNSIIQLLGH